MNKSNDIIKQGTILAVASMIVRFIGFLYRIPLTEMIGDKGIALYTSSFNIYTLFLVVSSQGLPIAIAKLVSEEMEQKRFYNAHKIFIKTMQLSIIIGLICSSVLFLGSSFIENIINMQESRYTIKVLAVTVFVVCIMAVFRGYFQGMNNTLPTALSQIFEQVINAIISVYFAYLLINSNYNGISKPARGAIGGTFGTLFGALAGLIVLISIYFLSRDRIFKRINKNTKFEYETKTIYRNIFKTSIPIVIGTAIFSITNIIDNMMIMNRLVNGAKFTIDEATILYGQYGGKYTVISNLPISIATAFSVAGVPVVASLKKRRNYKELNEKINSIVRIAMLICVPASFGILVLADKLLVLLYPSYSEGGLILRVGSISIIFIGLSQVLTGILQGLGYSKIPVRSAFLACLIKIPLNFILIGNAYLNIYGAIISTTITYMITSFLNYKNVKYRCRIKFDFTGAIIKPCLASIIMSLFTFASYNLFITITNSNTISVVISLLFSILVYGITLILIKGLKEEDLSSLPKGNKLLNILKSKNLI